MMIFMKHAIVHISSVIFAELCVAVTSMLLCVSQGARGVSRKLLHVRDPLQPWNDLGAPTWMLDGVGAHSCLIE